MSYWSDLERLQSHRQQLPALQNKTYFNYGGQGPLPQSALDGITAAQQHLQVLGPFSQAVNDWMQSDMQQTRQAIATELGVSASAISLTENVMTGCNIPLWGMPWQAGDHILLSDCEYPGAVAAVNELSRRLGLEVSIFPLLNSVADAVATIEQAIRPTTRLLIISHVLWNTGQVLPLESIIDLCHQHHVRVLVDAAQSVGMLPLDLSRYPVDFYAFTGHKWWCGPAGLGGLYVRPELLEEISPTYIGWRGIRVDGQANPIGWQNDGRRFEVATSHLELGSGLRSAIATHHAWGTTEERYFRICQLSNQLWGKLNSLSQISCLLKVPPQSGLVSFQIMVEGVPSPRHHKQLVAYLETQGFYLRTLLSPNCIRACTHYFTLESEIDRLVDAIENFLSDSP